LATRFVLGTRWVELDHAGSLITREPYEETIPPEPAPVPPYGLSGQWGVTMLFVPKPVAPGLMVGPVGVPPEPPAVLVPKGGDVRLVTCANAVDSLAANTASVKTTRLRYTLKILSHVSAQRLDNGGVQPRCRNFAAQNQMERRAITMIWPSG
jgi:hypothetical protein